MVPKIRKIVAIAEDSPTQAEELKYILEKNGYKVLHGLNGQEVMKLVRKDRPLLVIADILMPVMDGYELCRRIKTDDDLSKVPVILLTSLTHTEDVLKGLECGADSYVMKPFNEEHLMSRIYSVLNSKPAEDDERMEQENIDVLFEGKKYLVNSTRFQILNMLLSTYDGAVQKTRKLIETQAKLSNLGATLEKKVEEKTADLQMKITEREQIEIAIKASERKYRNLVENALVGVFSSNLKGQFQFVNEAFCAILHYDSAAKLISKSLQSLIKSSNDYKAFLEELRKNNQVKNYELEMVSLKGHTRWVIINALLRGDIISGMILDITERKKSEKKEIENQEELRIAKEKAEESDRLKSAFLANMSHEIRTPMNTILGFSSLLTDPHVSSENRKNYTNRISENCYYLLNLIENILYIAKLDAGKLKLYKKECFLNQLLADIYSAVVNNHKYKNKNHISFSMQAAIQDKNFSIFTDPIGLQQILLNLLDNAFKFTENGTIGFGYAIHDDILQFFVKDTGMGLAENQREIVFDSFRKVEDTKTKLYSGAGLGLAICKKLITLFDGKIWVEAERGKGSAFYFTIPLLVVKKPVIVSEEKAMVRKSHSLKDKKILVAEDDMLNYKLIEEMLSKSEATLSWARDGMEAVELIKSGKDFDLVLMDLRMPNMDGFQAAREIRGLKKSLPVIAVTAYSMGDEKDLAFLSGFNDYLTKPVNQEMLLNAVNKYICEGVA
jgi:PAS domain S-box-containing protein